ncbi:unnamed protein product [Allacma fusca]|uniref:Uncharacterized protein n=1 Tax=Allacma fusca TaxID=39272 RepID=A0A8J2PG45_9HEXA|nr:unnamed protein product [Allacma fusca]
MFKVESSSAPSAGSALSLNPQNNFDFGLSFCDDGTTDDLFDSFPPTASSRGENPGNTATSAGPGRNSASTNEEEVSAKPTPKTTSSQSAETVSSASCVTPMDTTVRIKTEPMYENATNTMPIKTELERDQRSPGVVSNTPSVVIESSSMDTSENSSTNTEPTTCIKKGKFLVWN